MKYAKFVINSKFVIKQVEDLINAGLAKRIATDFFLKNENVYRAKSISKGGGSLFSIKGNGMFNLNRAEYTILQELKSHGGLT